MRALFILIGLLAFSNFAAADCEVTGNEAKIFAGLQAGIQQGLAQAQQNGVIAIAPNSLGMRLFEGTPKGVTGMTVVVQGSFADPNGIQYSIRNWDTEQNMEFYIFVETVEHADAGGVIRCFGLPSQDSRTNIQIVNSSGEVRTSFQLPGFAL